MMARGTGPFELVRGQGRRGVAYPCVLARTSVQELSAGVQNALISMAIVLAINHYVFNI
jgi:hypothetical protein